MVMASATAADTDDDGDGMPDAYESSYGLDPLNSDDAALDTDSDGVSNLDEYLSGSNPTEDDYPPDLVHPFRFGSGVRGPADGC